MSGIKKRSVTISRHRTSVSLEEPFWQALVEIAKETGVSQAGLVTAIDAERVKSGVKTGLSSALRVYILRYYSAGGGAAASTKSSQTGRVSKSKTR